MPGNLYISFSEFRRISSVGKLIILSVFALCASLCDIPRCEAQVLISNLVQTDIGSTGTTGTNTQAAGAYSVTGAGTGIGGAASDSFSYLSVPASGNLELIAKVASQTFSDSSFTSPYAFTGLMFRSTVNADSIQACVGVTPSNGVNFSCRTTTGGSTSTTLGPSVPAPIWLRLVKSGQEIASYQSPDGLDWTLVGKQTVNLPPAFQVGFAVSSNVHAHNSTGTFQNTSFFTSVPQRSSNMLTWLRSDAGIVAASGKAARWNDNSGKGNFAIQTTPNNQPMIASNSINGLTALTFDGTDDFMSFPSGFANFGSGIAMYAVAKPTSGSTYSQILCLGNPSTTNNAFNLSLNPTSGHLASVVNGSGASTIVSSTNSLTLNQFQVIEEQQNGATATLYTNGVQKAQNTSMFTITNVNRTANFLGKHINGTLFFPGQMSEILMYNRSLNPSERLQMQDYFFSKYNIGAKRQLVAPVISPEKGILSSAEPITITAEPNTAIFYTTDGSTPTSASNLYTGPFVPSDGQHTIKAIAWGNSQFYTASAVTSVQVRIDSLTTNVTKASMLMWLRSDTGVVSSLGKVSEWKDSGPFNNNATQATSGNQPTLVSNALGSQPAIEFNTGPGEFLNLPTPTSAEKVVSLFVVTKPSALTANSTMISYSPASGNDRIALSQGSTGGTVRFTAYNGASSTNIQTSSSVMSTSQYGLFEGHWFGAANTGKIYANANESAEGFLGPINSATRTNNYIGQALGGTNRYGGQIVEILAYSGQINELERVRIESYIYQRYGISNPPHITPPTIAPGDTVSAAAVLVSISHPLPGTTIHYTVDGSTPTTSSPVYTAGFEVDTTTTVKAIAINSPNYLESSVATALIEIDTSTSSIPKNNLQYWLKADNGVSVSVNPKVSSWTNLTHASGPLFAPTAGTQPTLVPNAVNGRPAVSFNGSSEYLVIPADFGSPSLGLSIFVVNKPNTIKSGARFVDFGYGQTNNDMFFGQNEPGQLAFGTSSGTRQSAVSAAGSLSASKYQVSGAIFGSDGTSRVYQNGIAQGNPGKLYSPAEHGDGKYLGRDYSGTANGFLNGEVAEIFIYNRALSDEEIGNLQLYLKTRYQLVAPPEIDPRTGVYSGTTEVKLKAAPGAVIKYTTNGTDPNGSSPTYSAPFNVSSTSTVKAIVDESGVLSPIASAKIQIESTSSQLPRSGLQLWLKSDNTLLEGGGGTKATFWQDLSGAGHDAFQNVPSAQPSIVGSAISGKPAIGLDGSAQFMQFGSGFETLTQGTSMFVVTKAGALTANAKVLSLNPIDGTYLLNFGQGTDATGKQNLSVYFGSTPTSLQSSTAAFSTSAFNLHEAFQHDTSAGSLYLNGIQNAQGSVSDIGFVNRTQNFIGQGFDGVNKFNGQIAEVIIYDRPLNAIERSQVEGYIFSRYSLPLAMPIISPGMGVFSGDTQVTISSISSSEIRYTTDGSTPTPSSTPYTGPFTLSGNGTKVVRAIAVQPSGPQSAEATATIQIDSKTANLSRTGLNLWLKADYGVGISTGTNVSNWVDASGSGYTAGIGAGGNPPDLVNSAINGLPAVSFNGTNDWMQFGGGFANFDAGATVLIAVKPSTMGGSKAFFEFANGTSNNNILFDQANNSGRVRFHSYSGASDSYVQADTGMTTSQYCILEVVHTGGQFASIYKDGVLIAQDTMNNIINVARTGNFLGVAYPSSSGFYAGQIAEMLIYNRGLSKSERMAAEGYLFSRYGFGVNPPRIFPGNVVVGGSSVEVSIASDPAVTNSKTYYTTDGSDPVSSQTKVEYTGPFSESAPSKIIKAATIQPWATSSIASAFIQFDTTTANVSRTGLNLWLKADYGTTTNVSAVTNWADMSASGNDASQATAASQPTLVSNSINSLPAVSFDGSNDSMQLPPSFTSVPGASIFLVAKVTSLANGKQIFNFGDGNNTEIYLEYDSSGNLIFHVENAGSNSEVQSTGGITAATYKVIEIRHDGAGTASIYSNGSLVGKGPIAFPNYITRSNNSVGKGASTGNYLTGQIAEFMFYSRPLSESERFYVNAYLSVKYHIIPVAPMLSVPTGMYSSSQSVTMTAETGASIYYTTDGTAPTTGSTLYTSPISVTTSATLKAISHQTWGDSPVSTSYIQVDSTTALIAKSGMNLWLRADIGTVIVSSAVSDWIDMSNSGNSASQITSGNRPTVVTNAINGKPTVKFASASSQFMQFSSGFANFTAGAGIFLIVKPTTLVNNKGLFDFGNGGTNNNFKSTWDSTGLGDFGVVSGGVLQTVPYGTLSAGTSSALGIVHSGAGTASIYLNGTLVAGPTSIANIVNILRTQNYIGRANGNGTNINGEIAEVIVYNRAPTTFERQTIDTYFSNRYGLGSVTQLTAPTISPSYAVFASGPQTITITSSQSAPIFYTTDGSTPTTSSTQYTTPFNINATTTIKAIAASPGFTTSAVATSVVQIETSSSAIPRNGLKVWLRANNGPATNGVDAKVISWADVSGSGNHLSQSNTANQPTLISGAVNSLPVVELNGSTQFMQFPTGFADFTQGLTAFVVTKPQSIKASGNILTFSPADGNGRIILQPSATTNKSFEFEVYPPDAFNIGSISSSVGGIMPRQFKLLEAIQWVENNVGAAKLYSNGSNVGNVPSGSVFTHISNVTRTNNYLGQNHAGGDRYLGQLAEVLLYNRKLSQTEQTAVETYLLDRFAIVSPPIITPSTGMVGSKPQTFSITADPATSIYYTTNGTDPTTGSTPYTVPFTLDANSMNVKAIAVHSTRGTSAIATSLIQVEPYALSVPTNFMSLWLKSDFGLTTGGGNAVSRWSDVSGMENDAVQATGASQPTLVNDVMNGKPAVEFNGTSHHMQFQNDLAEFSQGFAAFIVSKPSTLATNKRYFDFGTSPGNTDNISHFEDGGSGTSASAQTKNGGTASTLTATNIFTSGQYKLVSLLQNGAGSGWVYQNGQIPSSGSPLTNATALIRNNNTLAASGATGSISNYFSGQIAEVIIYGKALTDGERTNVESYLRQKYQVSNVAPAAPIISVPTSSPSGPIQVAISAQPNAVIRYTTDGSTPTASSPLYSGPIRINCSLTLNAIAIANGLTSSMATATYTLDSTQWPAPNASDSTPLDINLQLPTNAVPQ